MVVRIIHMIGSLDIGGSQTMIMNIYRKIDRNRIQFDFIVDHSDQLYFKEEIEKLGGRVFVMPRFNGKNIFKFKSLELFLMHIRISCVAFSCKELCIYLFPDCKET